MRKWLAALGLIVLALAIAVGAKTLATPSRQLAVAPAMRGRSSNGRRRTAAWSAWTGIRRR